MVKTVGAFDNPQIPADFAHLGFLGGEGPAAPHEAAKPARLA
jgi:hypothetical protein